MSNLLKIYTAKRKISRILVGITSAIAILTATGYYYVFILGAPQLDAPKVETPTKLKFELESFNSQAMDTRQYGVILPPDYQKNLHKRYPVIFLLHGGHDDARAYVDKYGILNVLDELYQSEKLPPCIIITPDGNDLRGSSPFYDPDYYDGPNGKIGTLIGLELVTLVKSRYRTLEKPQFWALGGLSSGGWGAFNIGLRYLNNFNILFSHSGYFTDDSGSQNSPQQIVQKLSFNDRKRLRVYLDAGKSDRDLLASTKTFHETLTKLGISHVFYAFPGGHGLSGADVGWNYFHKHLKDSLSYVGQQFKELKS
ncbi:alpha/beta hydrolase-fold protein [Plectonema radiosum NIES-515]|uniref:Alpha/beta hydrolase-fold protein n=1 Tax=Plectonema radiosum NIES-515 TaxID=2986073 RepID=A0ABT3B2W1_9CYAN|nr:alpha/beta hydrolase-fold protein [Plectonema radiosum]MCV3215714.1 alpha/beta hydrolase-fold protein [Plectonema radiosum NIES-515]